MASRWQSKFLTNGIRAITGGKGTPVVLISGWPQTAEAFNDIFEPLAQKHRYLALDPPGLGQSAPATKYDTASISNILAQAVESELKGEPYHLVGHDVGGWIVYPWTAQHAKVKSLTILDAGVPGMTDPQVFPLSHEKNKRLWQFSFNALPKLPEMLFRGHEREFLTWFSDLKTHKPGTYNQELLELYIRTYSNPDVLHAGFEYYRAAEESAKQNLEFAKRPLSKPTLALGGSSSVGMRMVRLAQRFASNVDGGAIEECGHFLTEEQPQAVSKRLLEFFARA